MKRMKKWILLAATFVLSVSMMAQDDDMYFVPTKKAMEKEKQVYGLPRNTYYSGSKRSVDDYNGRVRELHIGNDSTKSDVIDFTQGGVYSPEEYAQDYEYTRRMSRFDDYTPSEAYWEGYNDASRNSTTLHISTGLYPWYDTWYDPWYDPWYYGYYRPWGWYGYRYSYYHPWGYYGYYSRPWYGGGYVHHHHGTGGRGSWDRRPQNHRPGNLGGSNFGGYRGNTRTYGGNGSRSGGSSYGGSRSSGSSFGGYRSSGSSRSSSSSFGGSRSGGSSGGGVRSSSSGRSFGGRR